MKKSRFTETQIVTILKQADAGVPVKDICRQAGISLPTYYQWKSKYGGMEASDLKRVKVLTQLRITLTVILVLLHVQLGNRRKKLAQCLAV
jgi:transposase-like protein